MKVLHVLNSNRFSGAENVVCQIIEMFRGSDFEMAYCSPEGEIRQALNERDIAFYPMQSCKVSEVKRVISYYKPDIVHAHDMKATYICSKACKDIKLISHIHNNAFDSRKISLKSIAFYLASKKADHIFWVSENALNGYRFYNAVKKKSSVLYNVIDGNKLVEKMNTDKNDYRYDIVFVGRLTYVKNPQRLLDVCKLVSEANKDVKIAIVGDGELADAAKEYCNTLNLSDNVDFLGFRANPFKIVHDAKCFVMTSHWEGLPMCILEALALGVPVVSTPVGGIKEIIRNGYNGYLSEEDSELSNYILQIISDEKLRDNLGKNCVECFNEINDTGKYKACLEKYYSKTIKQ